MSRFTIGLYVFLLLQFHAGAGGYLIDGWDTEQGLPDDFVTSIVQTPDGYLWIGTYNGLARFDGSRFVTFQPGNTPQLGHERIMKLFVDAQGTLWINTYDGSLTTWRNGVFTREWNGAKRGLSNAWLVASNSREIVFSFGAGLLIRRPVGPARSNGWQVLLPPGQPPGAAYCEDNTGTLWCSTLDGHLWRVVNGRYLSIPGDAGLRGTAISWLAPDLSGRIWVGTDREMAAWDGTRFQDMAPQGEPDLDVVSLTFTGDGGVLVGANGRLRKWLNRKWVGEFPGWPELAQEAHHDSIHLDREGGLWEISRTQGILHMDPAGAVGQISVPDGLPGDHSTCWLEDQEGNIWVGLGHAGFARLRKKPFEVLTLPGQPARAAMTVCEDEKGALWIGTYGAGLNRWQNGAVNRFQFPALQGQQLVFSTAPKAPGQLWISAGMEDLSVFQDGKLTPSPVAVHAVKSILVDHQGRVWLGRKDGVDCWADGKLREWSSHNGSIATPVRALAEDTQGVIWMGADDGALYHFDGAAPRAIPLPDYPAHQAIWSLLADPDGTLWIGTADAGLLHFESGRFTRYTARDGLPDDMICQILDDQHGSLWLGTHHGICRVSKAALRSFDPGRSPGISCSIFGKSDGLPTLECTGMYQPSAWRGRDGRLWFATARGVVGVQPGDVPVNSRVPTVIIDPFLVNQKMQALSQGPPDAPAARVPPGAENFEFDYTALSLTDPEKIQYRYKLEGFDSDWINSAGRRSAQYNYLKPGTYRFRVVASNNDGLWNDTGASLKIIVLPHFWETWWFPTLVGAAALAGAAGIARYVSLRGVHRELARLRDLEKDRARIARDIHDHIGSGLTRIQLLNELLLGDPPASLPDRVGQIGSVTRELMSAMDEIVWALNPKNDTLESLVTYLCDFAEEYLRAAKIRFRIDLPTPLPAWYVTPEARHNLFLAVKEIVNNIVKHAGAGEVFFTVRETGSSATLEIRDNGRGFPVDVAAAGLAPGIRLAHGNGLENISKRAAAMGGQCVIESEPGRGTRIQFTIPGPLRGRCRAPAQPQFHPPPQSDPIKCPSLSPSSKIARRRARA